MTAAVLHNVATLRNVATGIEDVRRAGETRHCAPDAS